MNIIKVACVEDNSSLRKRFEEQFEFFEDIKLVATYSTGETALAGLGKLLPSQVPDIILMDIELPGMSGIETTIAVKELFPGTEVMMFTVFEDEMKIFHAVQAGAAGYLLKDDPIETVAEAIRELHAGGAPMSQSIARTVLTFLRERARNGAKTQPPAPVPVEFDLSERELELLQGLVHGETYQTLAKKHFISPHTVKTHIKNIYKKLHVHSRALAVRVALDRGLV